MSNHLIISLGEILWDVFPDETRLGGAPANYACHAAALNGSASMVSAVGKDELGARAITELKQRGVNVDYIPVLSDYETGGVLVSFTDGVPSYKVHENRAWDYMRMSDDLTQQIARASAIYFGTLTQRNDITRETIRRCVKLAPRDCLRILDINLRPPFFTNDIIKESIELADILKVSDEEFDIVCEACGIAEEGTVLDKLHAMRKRFDLKLVAYTRGGDGAILLSETEVCECDGYPTEVVDTVGAGDSFVATLTTGLLNGKSLEQINQHACKVAAYVCSQAGATPVLPDELKI